MSRLTAQELALIRSTRSSAPKGFAAGLSRLISERITTPLRQWRLRQKTSAELRQLDDHLLADIGLDRAAVEYGNVVVRGVALPPRSNGLVAALRQAYQRGKTIRELRALDDRVLADIGMTRGQIPEVVDALIASGAGAEKPQSAVAVLKAQVEAGARQAATVASRDHKLAA